MRFIPKRLQVLCVAMVVVVSLIGIHGHGYSMHFFPANVEPMELSHRDSLILEMVDFLQPDRKLNKKQRKHIEGRIAAFPHKVIRRDTISYFLNTAYTVAYYEFVKHDYKKAKKWVDEFWISASPLNMVTSFTTYSSIGLTANNSLKEKGKFKTKKNKNSWLPTINIDLPDSLKWDNKRTYVEFLDSFMDDVPIDCSQVTFHRLLTAYHAGGGRLELLNGVMKKGLIQRCVDYGRNDVLEIIYKLWKVSYSNLSLNKFGNLEYLNPTINVDSTALAYFNNMLALWDTDKNKAYIDSVIAVDSSASDLSQRIISLLNQHYCQSRFQDLIASCEVLQDKVNEFIRPTLHNYWGLGLLKMGELKDAIDKFDIAIKTASDDTGRSTMRLNKACALGEMGRTSEAESIFMEEWYTQKTPFDKFVWYDNLGYIFSRSDPKKALYYYEVAEKYLDSSNLNLEFKIRHFCRKAEVLDNNKFLQKMAIEKALELSSQEFCFDFAKGQANTELAAYYYSIFDFQEADRLFNKAYTYYKHLVPSDLRMIYFNRKYAANLCKLDRADEAISILSSQCNMLKENYGEAHPEYQKTLQILLQVLCDNPNIGRKSEIDSLHNKLTLLSRSNHNNITEIDLIKTEISYYLHAGNWKEAMRLMEDAQELTLTPMQRMDFLQCYEETVRKYLDPAGYEECIARILPLIKSGMISGVMTLSGDDERSMHMPLSRMISGSIEAGAYKVATELALFRKGLLFTKKKTIEQSFSKNRSTKKLFRQLQEKRVALNNAIAFNDSTKIPQLTSTIHQLELQLGNSLIRDRRVFDRMDRNVSMVTRKLSENDLAVEFIRYEENNQPCYAAALINRKGLLNLVLIGKEEEILSSPETVWNSIVTHLPDKGNLYFCPDGVLSRIGVEHLPLHKDSPSNLHLHRVFLLSDISGVSPGIGERILLLGVGDHNSPLGSTKGIDRGNWTDLPNVEYEIRLIEDKLSDLNPIILMDDDATEPALASLAKDKITTLHISTHGFYRNNAGLIESAKNPDDVDYNIARRFLSAGISEISGLVLREGNISWKSRYIMEEHDDLLTAEEIELLSFPNLNLTVLSACETGLGEIDSDGVWGLQRAFRIAGAKSLICSLAKVDDYWTAQFMDAFYEQAAQGNSIYDSFQSAQRWLRSELPDNPEIWSSFILIE